MVFLYSGFETRVCTSPGVSGAGGGYPQFLARCTSEEQCDTLRASGILPRKGGGFNTNGEGVLRSPQSSFLSFRHSTSYGGPYGHTMGRGVISSSTVKVRFIVVWAGCVVRFWRMGWDGRGWRPEVLWSARLAFVFYFGVFARIHTNAPFLVKPSSFTPVLNLLDKSRLL